MMISLSHYLAVSSILFSIGLGGMIINRHSFLLLLICLEVMLLAINLGFAAYGIYYHDISAHIMVIFIFVLASVETSVGIALGVAYFRKGQNIDLETLSDEALLEDTLVGDVLQKKD